MTIYCYPNCSTCKRATAYLERKGISYIYRNIKENRPSKEELEKIVIQSGKESRKFFNTSGQLYRSLELKDKIPELNDDQILDLLGSDGMLVKRPLLVSEKGVLVGFREAEWDA
ncbi:MAG: arsenate reductase family protein, partial [Spirochaetales bacterium]|nr:arsenate reductase family protein [Spirochaetales bacterium]